MAPKWRRRLSITPMSWCWYYRVLRCVSAEMLEPPLSIAICARLRHEINLARDTSRDAALRDVEEVLRQAS